MWVKWEDFCLIVEVVNVGVYSLKSEDGICLLPRPPPPWWPSIVASLGIEDS